MSGSASKVPIIDIYPEGDLVINLTILDPYHKPWPATSSDLEAPAIRIKVSHVVISVASSESGIGSTLKTLLDSDQCNNGDSIRAKRGMKAPCKEAFVPQGPGVRWYLKSKPTPRIVGISPPTEVDLVLRLSSWETFVKGHRDAFHNIFRILHFQQPEWEKDGALSSSFHLLGQVSELSWLFRCEKAIAPMIRLAKYPPPSDASRSSIISRIRMAFVWKDPDDFRKATSEYIFQLKGEGKGALLGAALEAQRGKSAFNDFDEMGVMTFLQLALHKARARMIQGLFRVVADTYHNFVEPQDYPKQTTTSTLALQLLLGGLVKAMTLHFPGECYRILDSAGLYPQDLDPNSQEYENQSPANIFSRLMTIKHELEIAWSAVMDCESKGVTEIVPTRGGGAGYSRKVSMPMTLGMPPECGTLPNPAEIFQAALDGVIEGGGLELENYSGLPRPGDLGNKA